MEQAANPQSETRKAPERARADTAKTTGRETPRKVPSQVFTDFASI